MENTAFSGKDEDNSPADGYQPGRIVISRAGRDKGSVGVITERLDEQHVLVADGDKRTVAKPKRKNTRHLAATRAMMPVMASVKSTGRGRKKAQSRPAWATDENIRRALAEFIGRDKPPGGVLPGVDDAEEGKTGEEVVTTDGR